jgi:predicted lactoylglutathione lyase
MSDAKSAKPRQIFVNLPVGDLPRAKAFYEALGFTINPMFTDENAACVVIEEGSIHVMLLVKPFFQTFTKRDLCDTARHTEALFALSCTAREGVDAMVEKALAGGGAETGLPINDLGFMYQRSFYDPDGHHWEVMWMAEIPPEGLPGHGEAVS